MDSRVQQQLPALLALAQDRSEGARIKLADKLAEVFLMHAAALTTHEEKLVNDLITDLLHHESPAVRQQLIDRFARAADAPRTVAVHLINGPFEIARGILAANQNLDDEDLITVVNTKGRDYAATVASRKEVSEAVADALVTTGDIRILQIVAENMGAKLSTKAIDILVDAARLSAILHKPILSRPELNQDSATNLYWWVSRDLRRATMERFGFGPGRLDAALNKAIDDKLHAHMLEKEDETAMSTLADWLEDRESLAIKVLPMLLRAGHYKLFNIALSRLSKLERSLVDAITNAPGGQLLTALCRAIGIDKGNFVSIFLMSRGGRPDDQIVHPRELTTALQTYDRLQPDVAQAMLQSWMINPQDLMRRAASVVGDES